MLITTKHLHTTLPNMNKVTEIIENSFLKELLGDETISDISFNGQDIYYFSSVNGRNKYKTVNVEEVAIFLRNIANHTNSRFSYMETFLDVSSGKYRLSAMHFAKSRYGFEQTLSFALRINHNFLEKNIDYVGKHLKTILTEILTKRESIVISGPTGVGKTTLQKYLLTLLKPATKILVIDNVMELGEVSLLNPNIDLTLWQSTTATESEIKSFIEKALRFHPDYLLIAESRGSEMYEIVQGSLSGHPNIVTIHAQDAKSVYQRLSYLAKDMDKEILKQAFPFVIQLDKKVTTTGIKRYINKIVYNGDGMEKVLYEEK